MSRADLEGLLRLVGHHHIPIAVEGGHLVGIITWTDLVRTLAVAVQVQDPAA